jgi:hypothetical protein
MAWSGTRMQKIMRLAHTFTADPVGVSRALPGEIRQWYQWHTRGKTPRFAVDEGWNEHLHKLLGAPWPCPEYQRFDEVIAAATPMPGTPTATPRCAVPHGAWCCIPSRRS